MIRAPAPSNGKRVENIQQKEHIMARTKNEKNGKSREAKTPAFIAWHVAEKSKDKSFWTRIGAAWDHDDGKGFTLQLDLVPVHGGRIVLREPSEPKQEGGA
jgi:hypothetical protein